MQASSFLTDQENAITKNSVSLHIRSSLERQQQNSAGLFASLKKHILFGKCPLAVLESKAISLQ